jgi:hypothetical protein
MGILRSIVRSVGGFFFVLFLSMVILMMAVIEITEYDNLKPVVTDIIAQQLTNQTSPEQLSQIHAQLSSQCSGKETVEMPVGENLNVTLNCSSVNASKPEDLGTLIGGAVFDKIYYKEYDCEFIQCYQQSDSQGKISLFSTSLANQFFKKVLIYLWIGTGVFGLILLISSKGWEIPKDFGKSLIVVGMPIIFTKFLKEKINLPTETSAAQPLIDKLLNSISNVYLIAIVAGAVLVVIGYLGNYMEKREGIKKK